MCLLPSSPRQILKFICLRHSEEQILRLRGGQYDAEEVTCDGTSTLASVAGTAGCHDVTIENAKRQTAV